MDRLVAIEAVSLPSAIYLKDVEEEFFDPKRGIFIVAEIDDVIAGFAHYSIQYDNAAWIETLRIDPELQKSSWDIYLESHYGSM